MMAGDPREGIEEALRRRVDDLERENRALRDARANESEAQADPDARLRAILESATDYAIVATDLEGDIVLWNVGARRLFGWEEAEVLGRSAAVLFMPEDREAGVPAAKLATARAEGRAAFQCWHVRKDGSGFFGADMVVAMRDGGRNGYLAIVHDRTEARRVEDAWRGNEERMRLILESATDYAIFTIDRAGMVTSWNAGAERLLGYTEEEIMGRDAGVIFTPADRAAGAAAREIETALAEGRAENERWHVRKDGSRFWGSGLMMRLQAGDSVPGLLKIMRDRTERRRADEMKQLLIDELNHRVKNALAVVLALAEQTLKTAETPESFAIGFRSRLIALAHAHDLLTREAWEGVSLSDILGAVLEAWIREDRVVLSGPPVRVTPKQALALTMAFHELATNAAKHGALSVPQGRVDLTWTVAGECEVRWIESGGPPVSPPNRRGFGTRVLNRALAFELDGPVDLRFEPTGATCTLRFAVAPDTDQRSDPAAIS